MRYYKYMRTTRYPRGGNILPAMRQSFTHSIETYFSPPTGGRSCGSFTTTYWKSFRSGLDEYFSSGTASTRAAPMDTMMRGMKRPLSLPFSSPTPAVPWRRVLSIEHSPPERPKAYLFTLCWWWEVFLSQYENRHLREKLGWHFVRHDAR